MTTAQGKSLFFRDFRVAVIWADERRLVLKLSGPVNLTLASLHAPCLSSKHTIDEVQEWWQKTSQILQQCGDDMKFLGCDANAPLASHVNSHHGSVGSEQSNEQGIMFESCLQEASLTVPSTFSVHTGTHATWQHPAGKMLRRDYVLLSIDLLPAVVVSKVLCDIDLGFSHVDHYPVLCQLKFAVQVSTPPDKIRWDRDKFTDPASCLAFQTDLESLPIPRWDVDIDSHNEYFDRNVLALAAKHFQSSCKPARRRPQLTQPTLNLIAY